MCTRVIMTSLVAADPSQDSSLSVDSHFNLQDIPSVPHQPTNFAFPKRYYWPNQHHSLIAPDIMVSIMAISMLFTAIYVSQDSRKRKYEVLMLVQ